MSKLSREEFESILEEAYIEGYNSAIEDVQEDILDEEAYDLEDEYEYYSEAQDPKGAEVYKDEANNHKNKNNPWRKALLRYGAYENARKKINNKITDIPKDYPNAPQRIKSKIEKDFGGKVPSKLYDYLARISGKANRERERGGYNQGLTPGGFLRKHR